jgi:hypothetical protein
MCKQTTRFTNVKLTNVRFNAFEKLICLLIIRYAYFTRMKTLQSVRILPACHNMTCIHRNVDTSACHDALPLPKL